MKRFSQIPFADKEKRRHDNIQTMKTNYQKEGYNIDVQSLAQAWKVKRSEEMQQELDKLKNELANLKLKKSYWENPQNVESIEKIKEMEESLQKSLQRVRQRKKEIIKQGKRANQTLVEPNIEPFEEYLPEMLSGNDEMLACSSIVSSENQEFSSRN
ncbi:uncharacterized protein LOC109135812 [Beta vulgaris subsp. vulgaris]|uniref:uncharacterized protein LOC109135812 n=1 Tax=Beta vulgaris subsp. vulgaris TaxID=3555 RepID=UPI002036E12D|nr:uncharacterized protein LOC109135812 [Beta vulgaris subsp. vulgaris]